MKIPLSCKEINKYADAYFAEISEKDRVKEDNLDKYISYVRKHGYINRDNLITLVNWKSPRSKHLCKKNSNSEVKRISKTEFDIDNSLSINILLALEGVSWPIASAILHITNSPYSKSKSLIKKGYPILDFRAIKTIRQTTNYSFKKWNEYTECCRKKANECGVSMRDLDRALWTYDKLGKNS